MTPEARRSWAAFQRQLGDVELHVLLRGLRAEDPRLRAADPVRFALYVSSGRTFNEVEVLSARMAKQAERDVGATLNPVTEYAVWFALEDFVLACAALAVEVGEELARRRRRGPLTVSLC